MAELAQNMRFIHRKSLTGSENLIKTDIVFYNGKKSKKSKVIKAAEELLLRINYATSEISEEQINDQNFAM